MAWRGMETNLVVDMCWMGWVAMTLGWEGWGDKSAHGICAPFHLFYCPDQKS